MVQILAVVTGLAAATVFSAATISARSGRELRDELLPRLYELRLPRAERSIRRTGRQALSELDDVLTAATVTRLQRTLLDGPALAQVGLVNGLAGPRLRLVLVDVVIDVHLFRIEDLGAVTDCEVLLRELRFEEPYGWRVWVSGLAGSVTCHAWRVHVVHSLSE